MRAAGVLIVGTAPGPRRTARAGRGVFVGDAVCGSGRARSARRLRLAHVPRLDGERSLPVDVARDVPRPYAGDVAGAGVGGRLVSPACGRSRRGRVRAE